MWKWSGCSWEIQRNWISSRSAGGAGAGPSSSQELLNALPKSHGSVQMRVPSHLITTDAWLTSSMLSSDPTARETRTRSRSSLLANGRRLGLGGASSEPPQDLLKTPGDLT